VTVDPRDWKKRNDLTINVGLGTGSKSEQLAHLQLIIAAQEKAIPLGLVTPKNAYESAKELTKLAGHKDTDRFFTPPSPQGGNSPIPPPPDPKQAEIAAKAQAEQDKMKVDQAHQQMKTQADIAAQNVKVQADIALEQQRFELERQMALLNAQIKEREHHLDMASAVIKAATSTKKVGEDGTTETSVDHALIDKVLSSLQPPAPPQRGMRVVRDMQGRITHTEPMA
jgi:hypothetical protein